VKKLSEEYDLKKSKKTIGQLYPVLVDAAGKVIDGLHRQEADPNWRVEVHPEIDSDEKFLIARCVANWHRRAVSREEKEEWINGLAKIYKKQGLKISVGSEHTNEIKNKVMEVTGLSEKTVGNYLSVEFKQEVRHIEDKPRVPASQRIEKQLGSEVVERHREEVKQQLETDIDFMAEVVKEHPEVVSKAIKRVSEKVEPTAVYIPPSEVKKMKERGRQIDEETRRMASDVKVQEKRRLFKNLSSLQQIAIYANEAVCPKCGASHENLVWKCCNLTSEKALEMAHKKLEAFK
jgi:hypothetical protein